MLEINNVQSGYGDIRVLRGINLGLSQGEFVGLWGHNGMGKSTLMRTILGYLPARNGAIRFDGRDITTMATHSARVWHRSGAARPARSFRICQCWDNLRIGRSLRPPAAKTANAR